MDKARQWIVGSRQGATIRDHLVASRGIDDIERFLAPRWPDDLHDPLLLPDIAVATDRLWRAIIARETIGIIGDYDVDGTPGAALLKEFLTRLNVPTMVILPDRRTGYGVSREFVDQFRAVGIKLFITVDCGVSDVEPITYAQMLGLECIVTDHHTVPEVLPPALAVVNPKRPDCRYPFSGLSGTGVAFKLVQALQVTEAKYREPTIREGDTRWLLDLVAIATVADMMPLVDENRALVWYGLKVLNKTRRIGLRRLLEALKIDNVASETISFQIGPKLNSIGRLETMEPVLNLLLADDAVVSDEIIKQILGGHTRRQMLVEQMIREAEEAIVGQDGGIIVRHESWLPGLTGLAAARLAEAHQIVAAVFAPDGGGNWRGSLRSPAGVDVLSVANGTRDLVMALGGHREAAGLTVADTAFTKWQGVFRDCLASAGNGESDIGQLAIEAPLRADEVTRGNGELLEQFQPFGIGFPEPLWVIERVAPRRVTWLKDGKHCRFELAGEAKAIYFGCADEADLLNSGRPIDVAGFLRLNRYNGSTSPQVMVKAIRPSE